MRISTVCRTTLGVCCVLAGGLALWRILTRPGETGDWEALALMGGWGLGLLPIQAVPYERRATWAGLTAGRRRRRTDAVPEPADDRESRYGPGAGRESGSRDGRGRGSRYGYGSAGGSGWQRGHQ